VRPNACSSTRSFAGKKEEKSVTWLTFWFCSAKGFFWALNATVGSGFCCNKAFKFSLSSFESKRMKKNNQLDFETINTEFYKLREASQLFGLQ